MMSKSNDYYKLANTILAVMIINHLVSAVDALIGAMPIINELLARRPSGGMSIYRAAVRRRSGKPELWSGIQDGILKIYTDILILLIISLLAFPCGIRAQVHVEEEVTTDTVDLFTKSEKPEKSAAIATCADLLLPDWDIIIGKSNCRPGFFYGGDRLMFGALQRTNIRTKSPFPRGPSHRPMPISRVAWGRTIISGRTWGSLWIPTDLTSPGRWGLIRCRSSTGPRRRNT